MSESGIADAETDKIIISVFKKKINLKRVWICLVWCGGGSGWKDQSSCYLWRIILRK